MEKKGEIEICVLLDADSVFDVQERQRVTANHIGNRRYVFCQTKKRQKRRVGVNVEERTARAAWIGLL